MQVCFGKGINGAARDISKYVINDLTEIPTS